MDETKVPTPCSIPECNTDDTGEPCDRHETEQAHAEGEHAFCGMECEATFPSEESQAATVEPPTSDTLPAWLFQRFGRSANTRGWDELDDVDQSYWAHHAAAVRRAVARGGFKAGA